MIENRKTYFMLLYTTVLTVIALVYGFSTIPNPSAQRELKLDHKRVTDLGELQYQIDDYYRNNNILPESLDNLTTTTYSYSQELSKTDPDTNKPYEYIKITDQTYQLCAIFTTDSAKEKDSYDNENYDYNTYKSKFGHKEGRQCFDFQAPASYNTLPLEQPEFYMMEPTIEPEVSTVPSPTLKPGEGGGGIG